MKKYILPLLCGGSLLHAQPQPSAMGIFDQLLPTAAPAARSASSLAEQHPSLAAIPADADLCLTLSQLDKSHATLLTLSPSLAENATLSAILHGIDDASIALGKDGIAQLTQLLAVQSLVKKINHLQHYIEYSTTHARALTLPDIIISLQLKPELMGRAKQLLAQLPRMITPELSLPLGQGISLSDIKLTQLGEHQAIQAVLTLHDQKKNYTILYKIDGNKLTLIGSSRPDTHATAPTIAQSMLSNPQAQQLPAGKDVTLLIQDRDVIMDIVSMAITIFEGDIIMRISDDEHKATVAFNNLKRAQLPALLPYFEQGLQASLALSPTPELELSWQDARYRFTPTATKGFSLHAKSDYWIESSAAQFPDFVPLLKQMLTIRPSESAAGFTDMLSAITAQSCVLSLRDSYARLVYIGIKDKALARKGLEAIAQQGATITFDADGRPIRKKPAAGSLPEHTTLSDHGFTVCGNPELQKTFEQAPAGPTQAGVLLYAKNNNLPFLNTLYGRWSNEDKTHTIKLRLTK